MAGWGRRAVRWQGHRRLAPGVDDKVLGSAALPTPALPLHASSVLPDRVLGTPFREVPTASCSFSAPASSEPGSMLPAAAARSFRLKARPALPRLLRPPRQETLRDPDGPPVNLRAPELFPSSPLRGTGRGRAACCTAAVGAPAPSGGEQLQTQLLLPPRPSGSASPGPQRPAALGCLSA